MPRILVAFLLAAVCAPALAADLTVGWISRTPELEYVWNSSQPRIDGWPKAGDPVTWRAHVRNFSDRAETIAYVWRLNGRELTRGTANLAPNAYTPIELRRAWSFTRQRLSISIDTANAVSEESETNNELEVFTDALAVGYWIEQSLYDHHRAKQLELGVGSTSFENWAQRHIELFNDMAAMAVYPETPHGVVDRLRVQKIVIVPDGALPLVRPANFEAMDGEPNARTHPDLTDRTVDLQWGFPSSTLPLYADTKTVSLDNRFYMSPVILHELGHARYLTDVYSFDVVNDAALAKRIDVPGLSSSRGTIYTSPEQGLMNDDFTFIDRYSAIALNRKAGERARVGHYNDPEDVGSFLNDLPSQNRLTIRDRNGTLLTNAAVEIYQSNLGASDDWYATHYDATPDLLLTTDANGQVLVGRSPFAADGTVVNYWRGSNVVAIVAVEKDGVRQFGYLESRLFNLAYWRGDTAFADHDLVVGAPRCAERQPLLTSPTWDQRVDGPIVKLTWDIVPGARSYTVYAANAGGAPRLVGTTTSTTIDAVFTGRTYWWVEASFNGCPPQRSDARRVDVQARAKRRAVR